MLMDQLYKWNWILILNDINLFQDDVVTEVHVCNFVTNFTMACTNAIVPKDMS